MTAVQHESDLRLARAVAAGDAREFDQFFAHYFPRLYRFVLSRLRGDITTTEDVCQQVMSRAMQGIGQYRGEAALFTWLCQIARHEIADHWKRQSREKRWVVHSEDDMSIRAALESIEADPVHSPEQTWTRAELARLVGAALDSLPTHYASALEWKYVEGGTVHEIAARLGQSVIAAQSTLARARGAFREAFAALAGPSLTDLALDPLIDTKETPP